LTAFFRCDRRLTGVQKLLILDLIRRPNLERFANNFQNFPVVKRPRSYPGLFIHTAQRRGKQEEFARFAMLTDSTAKVAKERKGEWRWDADDRTTGERVARTGHLRDCRDLFRLTSLDQV
jgi:hypothetical protein